MFKKRFLSLTLLFLLMVVTSCGSGGENSSSIDSNGASSSTSTNPKIVIKFWNGFTGPDGNAMQSIVDSFNKEYKNSNISVLMDKLPWDTFYQKLLATSVSGTLPDVVAMHGARLSNLLSKNRLIPLDDEKVSEIGMLAEDYIPYAWDAGVIDGTRYLLPLDIHPTAMYYNVSMLNEAGFTEPPKTWEEFAEMAVAMTKNGKYGYVVPSMYSITKDMFMSMIAQKGGNILDDNNNIIYNSAQGVEVMSFFQDLIYNKKVSPTDVGAGGDGTLFKQGKSGFYFDGPWMISAMDEITSLNYAVAPMPHFEDGEDVHMTGSHQFGIIRQNSEISEAKMNAMITFIKYVNEHSLDWAKGGQVPANLNVVNSSEFQNIEHLPAFASVIDKIVPLPKYEYYGEVYNRLGVAVSTIISNKDANPKTELDKAANDTRQLIAELESEK